MVTECSPGAGTDLVPTHRTLITALKGGTVILPPLPRGKVKLRDVKLLVQGHTAREEQARSLGLSAL